MIGRKSFAILFAVLALCQAKKANRGKPDKQTKGPNAVANPNDEDVSVTVRCHPGREGECYKQIRKFFEKGRFEMVNDFKGTDFFALRIPKNRLGSLRRLKAVVSAHENAVRGHMPEIADDDDDDKAQSNVRSGKKDKKRKNDRRLEEFPSYNVDTVNARGVWNLPGGRGTRGAGVKVCVVEDGIASGSLDINYDNVEADPGVLGTGRSFEHGLRATGVIAAQPDNDYGVSGIAPDAGVIVVRWNNRVDGESSVSVIESIAECQRKGADIVTFSVGGFQFSAEEEAFCRDVVDSGIVLVGASGNFHGNANLQDKPFYPANYDSFITTGSVDWHGEVSFFSSRGPNLDVVAPAERVRVISETAYRKTVSASGTSYAAPLVAGAAALLKAVKPDATPAEIKRALTETATKPATWPVDKVRDDAYGAGTINVLKAAEHILGNTANLAPVVIDIDFDLCPDSISFRVADSNGKLVMAAGPYPAVSQDRDSQMTGARHEWDLPRGCYTFEIFDSQDSGFCQGGGSFYVDYNGRRQVQMEFREETTSAQFGECLSSVGMCGDGIQEGDEECDDGNTISGDGCSATCQAEVCGNGRLDFGEECDDRNNVSGDGCSGDCLAEVCGNGRVDFGEECDDGNAVSGDGCSDSCLTEVCGNGRVDAGEGCDDGNTANGDGCSSICLNESSNEQVRVVTRMTLDEYAADETSWEIRDAATGEVVATQQYASADKSYQYRSFSLRRGCYELTLKDEYGDGMCCSGGVGIVTLEYDGEMHVRDYGFRSPTKTYRFGNCAADSSTDGVCPSTLYFRLLADDDTARQNRIKLVNMDTGVAEVDIDANIPNDKPLYMSQCVQTDQCYRLTFTDTAGDGVKRRPYSAGAKVAGYLRWDGKSKFSIPFEDTCVTRCIHLGSCSGEPCHPTGCSRRLRGN